MQVKQDQKVVVPVSPLLPLSRVLRHHPFSLHMSSMVLAVTFDHKFLLLLPILHLSHLIRHTKLIAFPFSLSRHDIIFGNSVEFHALLSTNGDVGRDHSEIGSVSSHSQPGRGLPGRGRTQESTVETSFQQYFISPGGHH